MLRLICAFVFLQYFLYTTVCEKESKDYEDTCSYNVIIPTTDIIKKCDDYARDQMNTLRKKYVIRGYAHSFCISSCISYLLVIYVNSYPS